MKRRNFLQAIGTGSLAGLSSARSESRRNRPNPGCPPGRDDACIRSLSANQGLESAARSAGYGDPRIEVNLAHMRWNLSQIRNRVRVPVMAVVKANAYGHGLVDTSIALEKAGAHSLMVGKLQEAVALREAGVRCPVLNFGPFDRRDSTEIIQRGISQSVYTEEVTYLDEAAAAMGKTGSVHIDIDTGMGRTGAAPDRAPRLIEKIASLSHLKVDGVCTTLTEDPDFDREQLRRFLEVCAAAGAKGISLGLRHAASSAAIFYSSEYYLDLIRPGITLYGYYPNARTRKADVLGLKPVLKLSARVSFIKELSPGESYSYLRAFKAERKMRIATVGIGYSDGYPSVFGGKVQALIRKKKFAVLEAVTANHTIVGLDDDREVRIGDEVTLIDPARGSGLAADDLAVPSGVGDYKILIGLNPLLPRTYLG